MALETAVQTAVIPHAHECTLQNVTDVLFSELMDCFHRNNLVTRMSPQHVYVGAYTARQPRRFVRINPLDFVDDEYQPLAEWNAKQAEPLQVLYGICAGGVAHVLGRPLHLL